MSRMAVVERLKPSKIVMGAGSLKTSSALTASCLDDLQLTIECMHLGGDVEYPSIQLMVAGEFGNQSPVVCAACQVHGLVIGRCLPRNGINEPHGKWLCGGVAIV